MKDSLEEVKQQRDELKAALLRTQRAIFQTIEFGAPCEYWDDIIANNWTAIDNARDNKP